MLYGGCVQDADCGDSGAWEVVSARVRSAGDSRSKEENSFEKAIFRSFNL